MVRVEPRDRTSDEVQRENRRPGNFLLVYIRHPSDVFGAAIFLNGYSRADCFDRDDHALFRFRDGFDDLVIVHSVGYVRSERYRFTFGRVIPYQLASFLTIRVIRGVVLGLGASASVFARRTN